MKNFLKNTNFFTIITKIILVILPFYVILSLSVKSWTWINFVWLFFKEFLIILAFLALIYEFFKAKKLPKFCILDYLVFAFFIYWIIITFANWLWFKSIFYWWRYDFIFLFVFLIYKHWAQFLKDKSENLIKLFLFSASISLFLWILVKFVLKEEILTLFGFVDYVWNWVYSGWVPNYHWLENSWIRRFQGILDNPNNMWFFLILFSWFFVYLQEKKNEFYVNLFLFLAFILVYLTFSRSAILWIISWVWILFLINLKYLYKNYKKYLISFFAISWFFLIIIVSLFSVQLKNIILRESSTEGHFSRMIIWIERFKQKPFWAWLAESWPAFRNIYPEKQDLKWEQFYIPESWFIQILTEWWIIYFSLYLAILSTILYKLFKKSYVIFATFFAILVMSIFLHIFEATYLSILLFILIALIIFKDKIWLSK